MFLQPLSELVNYLFEKEGEVVIPDMEFVYWNARSKKLYIKRIDSLVINVAPNTDLAMLQSLKIPCKYAFKQVSKAIGNKDYSQFIKASNGWLNKISIKK